MEANNGNNQEAASQFQIKEFLYICLSKWYLFAICLILAAAGAWFYLAVTEKVYQASASMMFKDDTVSNGDIAQIFSDIDGFNLNPNLSNELVNLRSTVLMNEVVKRMGLDVNYSVRNGLRRQELYGTDLPLMVSFIDLDPEQEATMRMRLNGDGTGVLSDFDEEALAESPIGTSDISFTIKQTPDTVISPLGRIEIIPNPLYRGVPAEASATILLNRSTFTDAVEYFRNNLVAEFESAYSSVIHVTLNDVNKERAKAVLEGVIQVYSENWIADRNQISVATTNFIGERLAVIESELGEVDTDISDYKSAHQMPDVRAVATAYFNRSLSANEEITQLSTKLTHARNIRDHLSNLANNYNILPAITGIGNAAVEGQIAAYNSKLTERNNLVANSSPENPVIVDMDNSLAAMRQSILSAIDSYIATINVEMRATQGTQAYSASQLSTNPNQARYLLSVERQQKVKESLYLYLLQKREENELSQAFTAYNFRIVTPPYAFGPVEPVPSRVYMIAIALGLLIPAALIFLLEMLNAKVRGRRDLEHLTVPFVGEIPLNGRRRSRLYSLLHCRKKEKKEDKLSKIVVEQGRHNIINEAFRVIRTNLEFMVPMGIDIAKVIMLTSLNPGSGKTFISLNLATVLSLKGKKVALVDLDLRKASLSESIDAPSHGVTNYLTGTLKPEDIAVKNVGGNEGLDIYPAGPIPPNPAELLYSERLVALIQYLKDNYDYVLIDCPPVEVVADAKIINRLVDLTVFIIRAGVLERAMLPQVQGFYDNKRYRSMAVILNGTDDGAGSLLSRSNPYSYTYGYGYGYGSKN